MQMETLPLAVPGLIVPPEDRLGVPPWAVPLLKVFRLGRPSTDWKVPELTELRLGRPEAEVLPWLRPSLPKICWAEELPCELVDGREEALVVLRDPLEPLGRPEELLNGEGETFEVPRETPGRPLEEVELRPPGREKLLPEEPGRLDPLGRPEIVEFVDGREVLEGLETLEGRPLDWLVEGREKLDGRLEEGRDEGRAVEREVEGREKLDGRLEEGRDEGRAVEREFEGRETLEGRLVGRLDEGRAVEREFEGRDTLAGRLEERLVEGRAVEREVDWGRENDREEEREGDELGRAWERVG